MTFFLIIFIIAFSYYFVHGNWKLSKFAKSVQKLKTSVDKKDLKTDIAQGISETLIQEVSQSIIYSAIHSSCDHCPYASICAHATASVITDLSTNYVVESLTPSILNCHRNNSKTSGI